MVIAFLGGYINVIYCACSMLTIFYRNFNLDMSVIKRIYSVDGRDNSSEPDFTDDMELLKHRVSKKKPFLMTFTRYMVSNILLFFLSCCCLNRYRCLKKRKQELENV